MLWMAVMDVFLAHTGNVELDGLTKMAAVPGLSTTQSDVRVFCYLFSLLNQTIFLLAVLAGFFYVGTQATITGGISLLLVAYIYK